MRLLLAVATVLALQAPARSVPMMDRDDFEEPFHPCARGKTWSEVKSCLDKLGKTAVLYQTDDVKVVGVAQPGGDATSLHLYAKRLENDGWFLSDLSANTRPADSELLTILPFDLPAGTGVRIAIGNVSRTIVPLGDATTTPAILRTVTTSVCMPDTWRCVQVMTRCEVYVGSKVLWTFRGEIIWHRSLGLRMRGNAASAGTVCRPPASMLIDEGN